MTFRCGSDSLMRLTSWVAFVTLTLFVSVDPVYAANGAEFQDLYTMVHDWSTGYLGKTIAVTFLLVGLGMGVVRGSVIAAVAAIAASVALVMLPKIVDVLFGIA